MSKTIAGKTVEAWLQAYPLLKQIQHYQPVTWLNPDKHGTASLSLDSSKMQQAARRWQRFAVLIKHLFPETTENDGAIASPLQKLDRYHQAFLTELPANKHQLYLKSDHLLPVAGSIKARGGMYEVLKHAETLAIKEGLLTGQDRYDVLASEQAKQLFCKHSIGVGSTGNLALSVGIVGTALGFQVDVHMSHDAKQWKKDLLRKHGAHVHEYTGDFSKAVEAGRQKTEQNPTGYFIDDENSEDLFLGYSVAAFELKEQLAKQQVEVNEKHPLFVYLPCGVGGAPGGIAYGLKQVFGAHVHCFFAEPTHAPAVLIGLLTKLNEKVSVQDFGLDNHTIADGLAVGRPSSFASSISQHTVSGIYTEEDARFSQIQCNLWQEEGLFIEPSATAGLAGPERLNIEELTATADTVTHIAWSTGGSLVPEAERKSMLQNCSS